MRGRRHHSLIIAAPRAAVLTALVLAGGCEATPPADIRSALEVVFGEDEIILSLSPNEVAQGGVEALPMVLEWEFGSTELEALGSIADIRFHRGTGLVIADGVVDQVLVLDEPAATPERVVGPGPGPGEVGPIQAALSTGSHIVVWGGSRARTFQVFEENGTPRASVPTPVPGDWTFPLFRHPPVRWEPQQMTIEYTSDRLVRLDAEHFIHILQDDERRKPSGGVGIPIEDLWTSAILYDLDGQVLVTLARYPAPRTRYTADHGSWTVQDLYAGRLRVSGSEHHIAVTHGDSAHVRVIPRDADGRTRWIRWRSFRPALEPDAVEHQVEIGLAQALADDPGFAEIYHTAPRSRRRREISEMVRYLDYTPDLAPEISNLWSDGPCIFIAGFDYEDSYDGTSSQIIGINTETGEYQISTIESALFRIRDVKQGRVLVTTRTRDGAWGIHVYKHGLPCH
jgi:hypothetical protein